MNTFLPPVEKPPGLMMKLAYYFTRKQFGKVLTPLKVHSARLPAAFGFFYARIGRLDKKLTLPPQTILLIRERVAQINICRFCMDIGRSFVLFRARDLRDRLAHCQRTSLQHDQRRSEHPFGHALRHQ
jgi:hypothetical protein